MGKVTNDDMREPVAPSKKSQKDDADHYKLAKEFIEHETSKIRGVQPVYSHGKLWSYDAKDGIWKGSTLDKRAIDVGKLFGGRKYCKRRSDFEAVADLAARLVEDDQFFADAPVGIAAPSGFWCVTVTGEIDCEPLRPEHRQTFRVPVDPVLNVEPPTFMRVLREGLAGQDVRTQLRVVQQLFGAALSRILWRYRITGLLIGQTASGKSTSLNVLQKAFPPDQVGAASPVNWDKEYYIASLAGVALNVVGELDGKRVIPASTFKQVTGGDAVTGRHPMGRPFTFTPKAAHIFNTNALPQCSDKSEAFFSRWRIVQFTTSVAPGRKVHKLDEKIVAEEFGEFLGWALEGAADVLRTGGIVESKTHRRVLHEWQEANNSALAFILDKTRCTLGRGKRMSGQAAFDEYRRYAAQAGIKAPFGRSGFYDAIRDGGGKVGVLVIGVQNTVVIDGAELVRVDNGIARDGSIVPITQPWHDNDWEGAVPGDLEDFFLAHPEFRSFRDH